MKKFFTLSNNPIVRCIAIVLAVWIANFNLWHWSSSYRYLCIYTSVPETFGKTASIGGYSIQDITYGEIEGFTCKSCYFANPTIRVVTHEQWIFEWHTWQEKYLLHCCLLTPFITLILLEFKNNKLFTREEEKDHIRKNRDIIQISINITAAYMMN